MSKTKYCLIIGNPLKRPRSVPLWNKFFRAKKMRLKMYEKAVPQNEFKHQIKTILKDSNFKASAITMPYKKKILPYVIVKDKISKYAQSINFIIKIREKIYGYNTDVYGALETIKKKQKKNIIIFGFGGAGEAILRCFYKLYPKSKFQVVSKKKYIKGFSKKRVQFIKKIDQNFLSLADLFINCSPLGSDLNKKYLTKTPLNKIHFQNINSNLLVFDIVYKPSKTLLGKLCNFYSIKYINGLKMNTVQAQKALKIIHENYKTNVI